jgi:thiosulfate/3-mercaptopyruvate sulfurtransferase
MKILRNLMLLLITISTNAFAVAVDLPGPLVDSTWLAANLEKVQIVDVRSNIKSFSKNAEFEIDTKTGKKTLLEVGGHIVGARLIDIKDMRVDRMIDGQKVKFMTPEKSDFEKRIQAAGIDADKPIVLISMGTELAEIDDVLRVYWQLKVYGEDKIAVLDGGMANWLIEGRDSKTDALVNRVGNWRATTDRSEQYFASSEDVVKAIESKSVSLIDSRDIKTFHGLIKRDVVTAFGHLEGAKLYPTDFMFKSAGGALKFMNVSTYKALMLAQGIDAAAPTITYCNTGHLASGTWFLVSELLGNKSAKLYDGSMHEWTLEKRPVVGAVPLN